MITATIENTKNCEKLIGGKVICNWGAMLPTQEGIIMAFDRGKKVRHGFDTSSFMIIGSGLNHSTKIIQNKDFTGIGIKLIN